MAYCDLEYKFKKIGKNVQIGKNVYFRYPEAVEIGDNVIIDEFCYFTTSMVIEDYVHIAPSCTVIGGKSSQFIMREFSALASGVRVVCASDDFIGSSLGNANIPAKFRRVSQPSIVEFKSHVFLGTGCVCHPGVVIHEGATVGSMSLVLKDLDPWWSYFGIPAKPYKPRNKEEMLEIVRQFKQELTSGPQ